MNDLGTYYYEQQDYSNIGKYYSMAIEKGNVNAKNNLSAYYETLKN